MTDAILRPDAENTHVRFAERWVQRTLWRNLVCALATAVAGMTFASGVYDDCVFLFEGGRDGFNGGTPDGILQKGELVDELRAGLPAHVNHQSTLSQSGTSNLLWTTEKVNFHAAGMGAQNLPCLNFKPYVWTVTTNATTGACSTNFNYGTVNIPAIGDLCKTNVYSAVFRVRRGDLNPFNQNQWFVSFGYNRNADGQGWLLGFTPKGTLTTHCTGSSSPGDVVGLANVDTNTWVDIGVVMQTNVVRYTLVFPGRDTTSAQGGPGHIYHAGQTFVRNGVVPNTTMNKAYIHVGGQDNGAQREFVKGNNSLKFFDGSIQRIAFWNRALTDREIAEAFAFPRPSHVFLGGQNGHADEFGQTDMAEATIGPDLVQKDSWANFPASFRAGDRRTIKFKMSADDATLSQLLVIKPLADSPAAQFRISLNGEVLAACTQMKAGAKLKFPIPALKNRARFLTGENTLLLERVDAGDPITVDAIWLGGSWFVGKKDNRQKQDFGWHYDYAYMDYLDTYSFGRALNNGSGAKNWSFVAAAPTDVAESYPIRYCVRYKVDACTDPDANLNLIVDTTSTNNLGNSAEANTDWWIPLTAGEHDLHLQAVGTNGVYYFDCHVLTFDPPPRGMVLVFR